MRIKMIRNIIICLSFICSSVGCNIQEHCTDSILYKQIFEQLKISSSESNKTISFKFDYTPNEFTLSNIIKLKIFSKYELAKLNEELNEERYLICETLKEETNKIISKRKFNDEKYYTELKYSKPLYLSENKACIFLIQISKNKNHHGGKPIGEEILFILNKNINGEWKFKERKALGMF